MKKVLLIEDDRFLIDDLRTFIEFEGYGCEVYTGPDEVLDNLNGLAEFDTFPYIISPVVSDLRSQSLL